MSYFCLVPAEAIDKEHLTLVWCGDAYDNQQEQMKREAKRMDSHCPILGHVYGYATFISGENDGVDVALIALPHRVHLLRYYINEFDASGRGVEWQPHITLVKGREKWPLGTAIMFTKAEWRI